jgi:drug/metabolite transporter (DMT)-like permease
MVLSYLGLALCFSGEIRFADWETVFLGSTLVLASAAIYSLFLIYAEGVLPRFGTQRFTALGMVVAALASFTATSVPGLFRAESKVYLISLLLAGGCTVLPDFLFGIALQKLGAARMAVAGMVGPASALLLGALFLQEPMGWRQWGGIALTLAGGAWLTRDRS